MSETKKPYRIIDSKFLEAVTFTTLWILLFASPLILGISQNVPRDWTHIYSVWQSFLPYLLLFLINWFFLLPRLFFKGRIWHFLLVNTLLICLFAFFIHSYYHPLAQSRLNRDRMERMDPPPGPPPTVRDFRQPGSPQGKPPRGMPNYVTFILISILMVGFETGMGISFNWAAEERKRIRREKENAVSQLAFLRNQVSPHFLMNTLNNIHSLIDIDQTMAKDTIIRLSRLMRHLLYDAEVEKIPLQKELDFISHYVELMRVRYGKEVNIELSMPEEVPGWMIPPILFTSFIENAFKYGISPQKESYVRIRFEAETDALHFEVENRIARMKEEQNSTGIGIENTRKRLDLLYGQRYSLDVSAEEGIFKVSLTIPV